jgi:hypothetical protein
MDGIIPQKQQPKHHHSVAVHMSSTQKSSTLNRKFVKKPAARPAQDYNNPPKTRATAPAQRPKPASSHAVAIRRGYVAPLPAQTARAPQPRSSKPAGKPAAKNPNIFRKQDFNPIIISETEVEVISAPKQYPKENLIKARLATKKIVPRHLTAAELKDRAIRDALEKSAHIAHEEDAPRMKKNIFKTKQFYIALALSIFSVASLGYIIKLNMPDISLRVAALQTGISANYPSFTPEGFSLSSVTSTNKNGAVEINFDNGKFSYTLSEENSSWDSEILKQNFVIPTFGHNKYEITKTRGLTIYISDSNAVWVSGGILYKITAPKNTLNKETLHQIATSI